MKQKTAMQELIDTLEKDTPEFSGVINLAKSLLETEKKQQLYFFDCCRSFQLTGDGIFNQVYNETFGE
jgi:hypothetical protein